MSNSIPFLCVKDINSSNSVKWVKDLNPDVFIGLQLPLGYSNTGFFKQTKTTFEQAKYNIVNLFRTIPGERLGQPTFGSVLHEIIFERLTR